MVTLLATSVALGIMARSFPQMNIFMVSMPLNIGIGFLDARVLPAYFSPHGGVFLSMINMQIKSLFKLLA